MQVDCPGDPPECGNHLILEVQRISHVRTFPLLARATSYTIFFYRMQIVNPMSL